MQFATIRDRAGANLWQRQTCLGRRAGFGISIPLLRETRNAINKRKLHFASTDRKIETHIFPSRGDSQSAARRRPSLLENFRFLQFDKIKKNRERKESTRIISGIGCLRIRAPRRSTRGKRKSLYVPLKFTWMQLRCNLQRHQGYCQCESFLSWNANFAENCR